ncbi:MAG: YdcF family protein [Desulforhopalus sp.]
MISKRLFTCVLILFCLLCLVATIQTSAAMYFTYSKTKLVPADLVIVFPGENYRIDTGIKRVKKGFGSHFAVVGKPDGEIRELLRKKGVPESIHALSCGKSRSTFEDVYQTAQVIEKNQLSSVIVVTSGYHLPRALFLLKIFLKISGQDVRIQGFPVEGAQKSTLKLTQYSKEPVKFWGSMLEMTGYYFTGQLVLDAPIIRKTQKVFKKNLLL